MVGQEGDRGVGQEIDRHIINFVPRELQGMELSFYLQFLPVCVIRHC